MPIKMKRGHAQCTPDVYESCTEGLPLPLLQLTLSKNEVHVKITPDVHASP